MSTNTAITNFFGGSHIIPFACRELWDIARYSDLIEDPFTDPAYASNRYASPTTRSKKDSRRIHSLENGILLCLQHQRDFDNFHFAINPDSHEIFSFHPDTVKLQGVEVRVPWDRQDALYPHPHPTFLRLHYLTSISKAMKGSWEDHELDDDDEDYEELSEPEGVENENLVR